MKKIAIQRRILNKVLKKEDRKYYSVYKQSYFAVLTSSGSSDVLNELKADYSIVEKKWNITKSEVYSESATIVAF